MATQCPHSLVIFGVNWCCQRVEGHDEHHITSEGAVFTDADSWLAVEKDRFEESLRTGRAGVNGDC